MDKRILLTLALGAMSQVFTHAWEPKGDKIKTVWAEQVTPENVWQTYPRPQLQRAEWVNLNGLWKYAVTDQNTSRKNVSFEGEILVPFAIESSLSGVQKSLINGVTGWTDRGVGDMYDVHNYPVTSMILPENNGNRISVLGELNHSRESGYFDCRQSEWKQEYPPCQSERSGAEDDFFAFRLSPSFYGSIRSYF